MAEADQDWPVAYAQKAVSSDHKSKHVVDLLDFGKAVGIVMLVCCVWKHRPLKPNDETKRA